MQKIGTFTGKQAQILDYRKRHSEKRGQSGWKSNSQISTFMLQSSSPSCLGSREEEKRRKKQEPGCSKLWVNLQSCAGGTEQLK